MSRRKKLTESYLNEVFSQVSAYQSEHKCSINKACTALSKEFNVKPSTLIKQFQKSRGINRVIASVAKKKVGRPKKTAPTAIAATSLSISSKLEAEKIIFDYIKGLSFFKRVLAVMLGLDKLCYNYGSKKIHPAGD